MKCTILCSYLLLIFIFLLVLMYRYGFLNNNFLNYDELNIKRKFQKVLEDRVQLSKLANLIAKEKGYLQCLQINDTDVCLYIILVFNIRNKNNY